jgi:hypothetical protein
MVKLKNMKSEELIAEWKMINHKIATQQSYGKFELNYRCELEEEIQKRGLKL